MIRIALALRMIDYYEHGIGRGVVRYAKTHRDWKVHGYRWMFATLQDLRDWDGDGVIARLRDTAEAENVRRLACPVVDVANAFRLPDVHLVQNDDLEAGRMAARYFREKGFTTFGYLGVSGHELSRQRLAGFREELGSEALAAFERSASWWEQNDRKPSLRSFVARQSKPAAFFAGSDRAALRFSEACAEEGVEIPTDVTLLSVSSDDVPCELANPSFSSIDLDAEEMGWQAAHLLHELIKEKPPHQRRVRVVRPRGIVERRSTETYASNEPLVSRALTYLDSESGHLSSVMEIAKELAVSRRTLENRFKRATGRTVHETILVRRIRMAKGLLQTTGHKVEVIAELSGFGSPQRFFVQFKRLTGVTPNQFRLGKRPLALRWP